jgi:thioredoxin-related protein
MESSNDLSNDLAAASKRGKVLVIVWEQFGCYYCKLMHEVNFQDHDIVNYVRGRFDFVQLDMRGENVVKDLRGRAMTQAMLARTNRVTGTPTVLFLDSDGTEIFRMPGYAKPPLFLAIFEYIAKGAYKTQSLREYIVAQLDDAKASVKQTN